MATVSAQIRLDPEVKARSMALFQSLGLDLSTAVNVFLRQCLIHRGLPFSVKEGEPTPLNCLRLLQRLSRWHTIHLCHLTRAEKN